MNFIPSYIKLFRNGELKARADDAYANLTSCTSCPRDCKVDRINGEYGICTSGHLPIVSSYTPHFGEEPVLSGTKGAGNIFFGNSIRLSKMLIILVLIRLILGGFFSFFYSYIKLRVFI